MSYEFQSKYNKNDLSKDNQEHSPCCPFSDKNLLKKKAPLSADKATGEYTYHSPYTSQVPPTEDYCCHHESLHHEIGHLQEKNARDRQQKSIDFIRKKLEEENLKKSGKDQNEN